MFKVETRYALHAMVVLAQHEGLVPNARLAERLDVSLPMVAKILNRLGHGGLVASRPGPGGGYTLARDAEDIRIMDVVILWEGADWGMRCILGLPNCGEDEPCSMHETWGELRSHILNMLNNHSVAEMAAGTVSIDLKVTGHSPLPMAEDPPGA
jgi:Rrf2 family protein